MILKNSGKYGNAVGEDFFEKSWEQSWTYIKTVVDVVREPMLILDKNFKILAANEPFYETFRAKPEDTIDHDLYKLGNGQWDIPELRSFLDEVLPKQTFFKGFEVAHNFPSIGRRVIVINARQLHFKEDTKYPPIILLAMEDITEMIAIAERMSSHINNFEKKITEQAEKMNKDIDSLQDAMSKIKKKK